MDAIVGFFNYLAHLPTPIADGLIGVTMAIIGTTAVIVIFRDMAISGRHYAAPIAVTALAWLLRWLAGLIGNSVAVEWLTFSFVILAATGLIWGIIVLIAVVRGK